MISPIVFVFFLTFSSTTTTSESKSLRNPLNPTLTNASTPALPMASPMFPSEFLHDQSATSSSSIKLKPAASTISQIQIESIARRLQLILPQIYQDIKQARIHLLHAVQTSNGGGDWSRMIVSDSSHARENTNMGFANARQAEQVLNHFFTVEQPAGLDSIVEQIIQLIHTTKQALEKARDLTHRSAAGPLNPAFSPLIARAQTQTQTQMALACNVLRHAASICWVTTNVEHLSKSNTRAAANITAQLQPITKALDDNAAEQKVLPFEPPTVPKLYVPRVAMKQPDKQDIAMQCKLFCQPRAKNKVKESGCIHGCRVGSATAVLEPHQWPGKWTNRVDCPEYCEKTVDQVTLEMDTNKGNDEDVPTPTTMEKEDRRAEWVGECHWSCQRN